MTAPVNDSIKSIPRTDGLDDQQGSGTLTRTLTAPPSHLGPSAPRRLLGSGPGLALATVLGGSLLAVAVGAGVVAITGRIDTPAPTAVVPITVLTPNPADGDTRHGLTKDAAVRRHSVRVVVDGPGAGDSRHGQGPDANTRRAGTPEAVSNPDAAGETANSRESRVAAATTAGPSTGDSRQGPNPDASTRR
jgi:hypothetical protein